MKNFLNEIVELKKKEIEALKLKRPLSVFVDSKRLFKGSRPFKEGISSGGRINLIGEIKKKSPSLKKEFFRKLDAAGLAEIYAENGANAISIITDKKFFKGNILHINEVRQKVHLPVLRKDFIIDEYQIYESRYFGADAILLIARLLTKQELKSFMYLAARIGMSAVVEVHDEQDLEKALVSDARIIGINNRDLNNFSVDIGRTFRLVPKIPKEIIKISESGIKTNKDISNLRKIGINAVLIGTAFLEAEDIGVKVKEIMR